MSRTVVEVRDLVKTYEGRRVLDGVSLVVREGEIFGFLGPNGAGKTTTLEIIEGLRKRDSGSVQVFGLDLDRNLDEIRSRLGVSLQKTRYWGLLTVEETLRLFQSFYPRRMPLATLVERFELGEKLRSRMRDLSGGQYQRVVVALALVNDPDLILLDEPTIGLDPRARRRLWDTILELKRLGKTVILTTHYMDEAEALSDRIAIIHAGRIVECGPPRELIRSFNADVAIRFTSPAEVPLDSLSAAGWCRDARRTPDDAYMVFAADLQEGIAGLLEWAAGHGVKLDDLETRAATLDDLFLDYAARAGDAP
jgi:ABC-2 type transport system ATP-binding protein